MKKRDNHRKSPEDLKAQFDKELEEYRLKCEKEEAELKYATEHEDEDNLDTCYFPEDTL